MMWSPTLGNFPFSYCVLLFNTSWRRINATSGTVLCLTDFIIGSMALVSTSGFCKVCGVK